jgi:hypothetical protein
MSKAVIQMSIEGTGAPTQPSLRLTRRQRFALELIVRMAPMPSDLLGACLHEYRRDNGARATRLSRAATSATARARTWDRLCATSIS